MSWTHFPINAGDDLFLAARIDEIRNAIKERFDLLAIQYGDKNYNGFDVAYWLPTVSGWQEIAPGDDVQLGGFYAQMQGATESIVHHFYNHIADVTPLGGVEITEEGSWREWSVMDWDPYASQWTLAAWRAAAGMHADGFERRVPNGVGGWTVSHGYVQPGDYLGPWILEELKQGLSLLTSRLWMDLGSDAGGANPFHVFFGIASTFQDSYHGIGDTSGEAQADYAIQSSIITYRHQNLYKSTGALGYTLYGTKNASSIRILNRDKHISAPVRQWLLMTPRHTYNTRENTVFSDFGYGLNELEWTQIEDSAMNVDPISPYYPAAHPDYLRTGTVDFSAMPLPFISTGSGTRSSLGMDIIRKLKLPSNPIPPSLGAPLAGLEKFAGCTFVVDFSETLTHV